MLESPQQFVGIGVAFFPVGAQATLGYTRINAGKNLLHHNAKRIYIAAGIYALFAGKQLGRGIGRSTAQRARKIVRIIIGKPYEPVYTGRRGTAEEMQKIADDLLEQAYALGGQAVGGKPL